MYVATLFLERSNTLVRIDVLEPAGMLRREPFLSVTTTRPDGRVEVEQHPLQPPGELPVGVAAVMQTLSGMVYSERGGGMVTYVHYSPDFDPTGFDNILAGINLAHEIVGLQTTRTVQ